MGSFWIVKVCLLFLCKRQSILGLDLFASGELIRPDISWVWTSSVDAPTAYYRFISQLIWINIKNDNKQKHKIVQYILAENTV